MDPFECAHDRVRRDRSRSARWPGSPCAASHATPPNRADRVRPGRDQNHASGNLYHPSPNDGARLSRRVPLGNRRPRTRSRGATGTPTGGHGSTPGRAEEVSGDACDHLSRYPADLDLLCESGFRAYRFSLEWSRIEPEEGEFSRAALDDYRRVIGACRDRDLVPVVTFHHFTVAALGRGRRCGHPRRCRRLGGSADGRALRPLLRAGRRRPGCRHRHRVHHQRAEHRHADGLAHGHVAAGWRGGLRRLSPRDRDDAHRAPPRGADALKAGPGDFPRGTDRVDERLGFRTRCRGADRPVPRAARGRVSRGGARRTTSSACRPARAHGRRIGGTRTRTRRRGAPDGLRVVAERSRGLDPPRLRRHRRPRLRDRVRDQVDDDGNAPATSASRSRESAPRSPTASTWRLVPLVAARQLRVGVRVPDPLRARRRRPGDTGTDAQAECARAFPDRPSRRAPLKTGIGRRGGSRPRRARRAGDAVAPVRLRLVEGEVGAGEQRSGAPAARCVPCGDADADGHHAGGELALVHDRGAPRPRGGSAPLHVRPESSSSRLRTRTNSSPP